MGNLFGSNKLNLVSSEEIKKSMTQDHLTHVTRVFASLKKYDTMSHAVFRRTFLP
jgi:hypothetical protein